MTETKRTAQTPLGLQMSRLAVLFGVYEKSRGLDDLAPASKRLTSAGYSGAQIQKFAAAQDLLNREERQFWAQMNDRNFSVEQMIAFVEAPRRADLATHFQLSREDIREDIEHTWKPPLKEVAKGVTARMDTSKALLVLCGISATALVYDYGLLQYNPAIQETAAVLKELFPHAVSKILESTTLTMVGMGLIGSAAWLGMKSAKRQEKIAKAKHVKIRALTQQPTPQSLVATIDSFTSTQAHLDAIPLPQRNLLTHLDGSELRLFLHGDNDLRTQILLSRPPSYDQRLSCILASDATPLTKWVAELSLAGTTWDGVLSTGPVGFKESLLAMRQRKDQKGQRQTLESSVQAQPKMIG